MDNNQDNNLVEANDQEENTINKGNNKPNNFFNNGLGKINTANNAINSLSSPSDETNPNETVDALNQMRNNAVSNLNHAANLATGIKNTKNNLNSLKNKKDKNEDNKKDQLKPKKEKNDQLKPKEKEIKEHDKESEKNKDKSTSGLPKSGLEHPMNKNKENLSSKMKHLFGGKQKDKLHNPKNEGKIKKAIRIFKVLPPSVKIVILCIIGFLFFLILFLILLILFTSNGNTGSGCSNEASPKDIQEFINAWEGTKYCGESKTKYLAYQNPGDKVTIGYGVTTDYIKGLKVGDCLSKESVDEYQLKAINSKRNTVKNIFEGVTLTNYQEDALTSFTYNGCANMLKDMKNGYEKDSYEGLWKVMKQCTNGGNLGLQRRKKAEFTLFVTGDYSIVKQYKSLTFTEDEYDNYNYDNIMSRKDSKESSCTSFDGKFKFPNENPSNCPVPSGGGCYGYRIHPIYGDWRLHTGVDLACPGGTKIIASASGKVIQISREYTSNVGYGAYVLIEHDDQYKTRYAHMSQVSVSVGDHVNAGQVIGKVGTSGASTGFHIHYEVYKGTQTVDPAEFIDLKGACD